jgi:hypothetical protein
LSGLWGQGTPDFAQKADFRLAEIQLDVLACLLALLAFNRIYEQTDDSHV